MEIKKGQAWLNIHNGYVIIVDEVTDTHVHAVGGVGTDVESFKANWVLKGDKPKQYNIGIDTFERCEANMTKEEVLACCKFNIDKYNWRKKGQDKQDLEKIINYAKWALKQL